MSKDTVWVSQALMDSTLIKGFVADGYDDKPFTSGEIIRRNISAEPMPAKMFPQKTYGRYPDKLYKKPPDIFSAGGHWAVSAECANVLNQFNLGKTSFYPLQLFQNDRTTPVEGDYFCINFGETKDAFVPEESSRARERGHNAWGLPFAMKDGDMALRPSAFEGVDLWMDQRVKKAFFLSDPLVKALKDAKLTRRFGLLKCRVLDT